MLSEKTPIDLDVAVTPQVSAADVEKSQPIVTDIGLQFITQSGDIEYTQAEENTVIWRIDLFLLSMALDKAIISYAAVYGMRTDMHLVGQQYSWAVTMFYFGYLIGQPPANYLIQKTPMGKFAAVTLFMWGALVMLSALARNFAGIAALRFFMGIFEAGIAPLCVHVTGMFYKGQEQALRCTCWYFFVGIAVIIAPLLSWGVGHSTSGIKPWKLLFIICGGLSIVWSFVIFYFLPDHPGNAKFLTQRQRIIAIERLRVNRAGVKTTVWKWAQFRETLTDPQVWMIALWAGISNLLNIGGSFLPIIIEDMGFTGLKTSLLSLPVGGVECIAMLTAGGISYFFENGRTVIMFIVSLPSLVGTILLTVLPFSATWGRCVGVWLLLTIPASYTVLLSLIASNVAGFTKKVTTTCVVFVTYSVGNIISPQLFITREGPYYGTGIRSMLVAMSLVLALNIALGVYYIIENRRRDRVYASTSQEVIDRMTVEHEEFLDRTDFEDALKFRYRW
ncbi:dipeptide transmembrane transporter [Penicillium taxi]|uniref:dipeptide transmembrane transporter n=1 Tax=Penicillium taxi TaxID=168475 RepID=UPI0025457E87|nr:dipeptide transmembrane transporter [Penicillium taxi]KAJ5889071.1 dipeptide transmembrane transporter [Penicillium taxi]